MHAPSHEVNTAPELRRPGLRRSFKWTAAMSPLLGLAVLSAGCGVSGSPGAAGSGSTTGNRTSASSTASPGGVMAQFLSYTRCMRDHGVPDFPDPVTSPGGGVAFQINGGPGSDLNRNNASFKAAEEVCRSLLPGGEQPPPVSAQQLAAEVRWARCVRSHGLPNFPDPDAQGAFDSSRFDESSPAFQTASNACKSLQPAGPTPVHPGRGNVSGP
jgi:hypothetical protein